MAGARQGFFARLFPETGGKQFFDLFDEHAACSREAATQLFRMSEAGADMARQSGRVKEVEHRGDEITHTVIERLHQTFITPIDRDDIHTLISALDDVLDLIDASAERIWLYGVTRLEPEAADLCEVLLKAVEEMSSALRGLRNLGDRKQLIVHCTEINRLENEGDRILRRATARLFKETSDPIQVIKWKEIYDNLENAIDRCEDVANVIEGVALEYS